MYLVWNQVYIAQLSKVAGAIMKLNCYNKFQKMWTNPHDDWTTPHGADFGLFYCCFLKKACVLFLFKKQTNNQKTKVKLFLKKTQLCYCHKC